MLNLKSVDNYGIQDRNQQFKIRPKTMKITLTIYNSAINVIA